VIVQEDHRADVAVVQIWYKVGASFEQDGATGVSHALEHMMFKRTKNLASGEFSRLVAARGGRENAFTTADYTTYFQQWSADNIELSFKLEADRMQNLLLDPEEFKNELKVIHEERRLRTEDNAQSVAIETVLAHTWQTSPYRQPVIGWAADIDQMQLAELADWYHRYYTPNNAILVVVGNVQIAAIKKLAEQYFSAIPRRELPPQKVRPEVAQHGEMRLQIPQGAGPARGGSPSVWRNREELVVQRPGCPHRHRPAVLRPRRPLQASGRWCGRTSMCQS